MLLEEIFRGNYSPQEVIYPSDPEYLKANQAVASLMDQLKRQLSPSQYQQLENVVAQIYNAQGIESEACFKLGFATGMEIEREVQDELRQESLV